MLGQLALWAKIASSDIPPLSQLTFFLEGGGGCLLLVQYIY